MSAISDFTTKLNAFFDRQDSAISGIRGDLKYLQDTIDKLQSTSGAITPEDQALLDQIEARVDAAATNLEALDALNPPIAPTA